MSQTTKLSVAALSLRVIGHDASRHFESRGLTASCTRSTTSSERFQASIEKTSVDKDHIFSIGLHMIKNILGVL